MTETERSKTEFLAFPLKVMISPFKAFKEIAQNPDIKGIVLIAGLILLATAGLYCAYSAKIFLDINGIQTSVLSSNMFSAFIASILAEEVLIFASNWLIYAGILFLIMKVFSHKGGSVRFFFILVSYAFSIMIIQSVVSAILVATLPEIHFSNLVTWPPSTQDEVVIANAGIQENWSQTLAFQAVTFFNFPYINIIDVWLVILSVIIVNASNEITWGKATMISITAFMIRFLLKAFLGI